MLDMNWVRDCMNQAKTKAGKTGPTRALEITEKSTRVDLEIPIVVEQAQRPWFAVRLVRIEPSYEPHSTNY